MSQSKALYRLQKLDLDLDAKRSRAREIETLLAQDSALRDAQAAVNTLQENLRPAEARLIDLNLELQSVAQQAAQLTDRLYGGQVTNPKELEDIQNKIAERKRCHAALENDLLETMIAVEELQTSLAAATNRLSEVQAAWTAEHEALAEEAQRLKHAIKTLKAERAVAAQQVSPGTLELYEGLRARKQGHAVALLQGESCSICGVGQTTTTVQQVRQDQELVMCASCGRILIALS